MTMDLALFDFDGTVTTRETFADFIRYAAPASRTRAGAIALSPMVVGYRLGWISGHRIRAAAIRVGLSGLRHAALEAHGRKFARDRIPSLLRPEMMARIDWHRGRGDHVCVVTGALDTYMQPWCDAEGLDLLSSQLRIDEGRAAGRYLGAQCVAAEKARRIGERFDLTAYRAVHAYGDTAEDFDMLRLAHYAQFRGHPWRDPETGRVSAVWGQA
jgi:HAD superfamily hydrolase (TIGR01490 family)